jgi:predicted SAM-dependent methyltransferase
MAGTQLRLNLGCGTTAPAGWVNIDRSPGLLVARHPALRSFAKRINVLRGPQAWVEWPKNIVRHDITKALPFQTESVDYVYSSHALEHLARQDAVNLIAECRRVLRPGGVLRLALPDLRALIEEYLQDPDPKAADRFMEGSGLGLLRRPRGAERAIELVSGARHRWMYDTSSLRSLCQEQGFHPVVSCTFRQGEVPDLAEVEHREDSLFLEATVPN